MYDGTEGPEPGIRNDLAQQLRDEAGTSPAQAEQKREGRRRQPCQKADAVTAPASEYERRMAEIDRLGDEIAVLSAQIQAATYELLVRLREFDQREGWGHHGAKSCAHWLAWRTSLDPGAAREWVRVARALEHLPALSEAMRQGEVSYSKARALTRIATPETDAGLVELARAGTAAHIERVVRGCRRYGPKEERDKDHRMLDSRYLYYLARRGRDVHPAGASRSGGGSGRAARDRCRRRGAPPVEASPRGIAHSRYRGRRATSRPAPSRRAGPARGVGARRRARSGYGRRPLPGRRPRRRRGARQFGRAGSLLPFRRQKRFRGNVAGSLLPLRW